MKTILTTLALTMGLSLSLVVPASADIFGEIGKLPKAEGFGESLGEYFTNQGKRPTIKFFVNAPQLSALPGETADQFAKRLGEDGLLSVKSYAEGYFNTPDLLYSERNVNSERQNILWLKISNSAFKAGGNIPENLVREYRGKNGNVISIANAYRYTLGRRPTIQEVGKFSKSINSAFYLVFLQLHKDLISDRAAMDGVLDRAYFATMGRNASAGDKAYWWTNRVQGESYANLCVFQRRWLVSDNGMNDAVGAIQRAVRNATGGKVLPADSPNLLELYGKFTNPGNNCGFDDLSGWIKESPKYTSDAINSPTIPVVTLEQSKKLQAARLKAIKPIKTVPPRIKL